MQFYYVRENVHEYYSNVKARIYMLPIYNLLIFYYCTSFRLIFQLFKHILKYIHIHFFEVHQKCFKYLRQYGFI